MYIDEWYSVLEGNIEISILNQYKSEYFHVGVRDILTCNNN